MFVWLGFFNWFPFLMLDLCVGYVFTFVVDLIMGLLVVLFALLIILLGLEVCCLTDFLGLHFRCFGLTLFALFACVDFVLCFDVKRL